MASFASLWPDFGQPYALLLTPLLWLLTLLLHRQTKNTGQWEHILPAAFHASLLNRLPHDNLHWPTRLLLLAGLLTGLALSQPRWGQDPEDLALSDRPLVVVIPLTTDSLAADLPPGRLQNMQLKTLQIQQDNPDTSIAVVLYAGSAHTLMPLTRDSNILKNLLPILQPSLMPVPGHNAGAAIEQAVRLLQQARHTHGNILLFSHALTGSEQQRISAALHNTAYRLHIIGIGTPEGAPLQKEQGGALLSDTSGNILISRLDESGLKKFAGASRATYRRMSQDRSDIDSLSLLRSDSLTTQATRDSQGYWLILPLLFILAPLARRGWLFGLLALALFQPPAAEAQPFQVHKNDPLSYIQADPQQALKTLKDPLWRGIAAYHAGNYALAGELFAQHDSPLAHYNRGNAMMQLSDYANAILAYQQALQLQPQLPYASDNLQLALQLLEQQQPADINGPPEQPASDRPEAPRLHASFAEDTDTNSQENHYSSNNALDPQAWLRQIPDNPGELLRKKFLLEHLATGAP